MALQGVDHFKNIAFADGHQLRRDLRPGGAGNEHLLPGRGRRGAQPRTVRDLPGRGGPAARASGCPCPPTTTSSSARRPSTCWTPGAPSAPPSGPGPSPGCAAWPTTWPSCGSNAARSWATPSASHTTRPPKPPSRQALEAARRRRRGSRHRSAGPAPVRDRDRGAPGGRRRRGHRAAAATTLRPPSAQPAWTTAPSRSPAPPGASWPRVADVAPRQPDRTVTVRGPRADRAFDAEGAPDARRPAGFARKQGLDGERPRPDGRRRATPSSWPSGSSRAGPPPTCWPSCSPSWWSRCVSSAPCGGARAGGRLQPPAALVGGAARRRRGALHLRRRWPAGGPPGPSGRRSDPIVAPRRRRRLHQAMADARDHLRRRGPPAR